MQRLPCLALPCLIMPLVLGGCGGSSVADREVLAVLNAVPPPHPEPIRIEHDFGPVLARGQTLRHEFLLSNPTDRPIRLRGAEATTPCCSAVESVPESIPARGTARLPIVFRPGFQSGSKRIGFVVATDSEAVPAFELRVQAMLFGEVEIQFAGGTEGGLAAGRGGNRTLRVIGRSAGGMGRRAPDRLTAVGPISARFVGPTTERTTPDDLLETVREVEVVLEPADASGTRRGEVRFLWPEGGDWPCPVVWEVRPLVQATPSGLMLPPGVGRTERTILIRSEDRPIRVLSVSGAAAVEAFESEPRTLQTMKLVLDSTIAEAGASDITVVTDHPRQPRVVVSVLVPPTSRQEQP